MELTTNRTAELAFPIEDIMDRLFYFFPEGIRDTIHYKLAEDGKHLIFSSDNATDEVVRLLEEARDAKHEPPAKLSVRPAETHLAAIDRPGLSVRTLNALYSAVDVKTWGELVSFLTTKSINEVLKSRGAGKKTLDELKNFVEAHLPHLKQW